MKTIFKTLFYIVLALLFVWIAYSWYDVMNYQWIGGTDWTWNFFVLLFG